MVTGADVVVICTSVGVHPVSSGLEVATHEAYGQGGKSFDRCVLWQRGGSYGREMGHQIETAAGHTVGRTSWCVVLAVEQIAVPPQGTGWRRRGLRRRRRRVRGRDEQSRKQHSSVTLSPGTLS